MVYRLQRIQCHRHASSEVRGRYFPLQIANSPTVRPHYVVFPEDEAGFSLDEQYFVGSSGLLVKPVTEQGVTESLVYLSEDQVRRCLIFKTPLNLP
jgi:hypothetical protein